MTTKAVETSAAADSPQEIFFNISLLSRALRTISKKWSAIRFQNGSLYVEINKKFKK